MASEKTQNYANHAQFVPGFHIVLFGLIVLGFTLNPSVETSEKGTGCRSLETFWRTGVAVAE